MRKYIFLLICITTLTLSFAHLPVNALFNQAGAVDRLGFFRQSCADESLFSDVPPPLNLEAITSLTTRWERSSTASTSISVLSSNESLNALLLGDTQLTIHAPTAITFPSEITVSIETIIYSRPIEDSQPLLLSGVGSTETERTLVTDFQTANERWLRVSTGLLEENGVGWVRRADVIYFGNADNLFRFQLQTDTTTYTICDQILPSLALFNAIDSTFSLNDQIVRLSGTAIVIPDGGGEFSLYVLDGSLMLDDDVFQSGDTLHLPYQSGEQPAALAADEQTMFRRVAAYLPTVSALGGGSGGTCVIGTLGCGDGANLGSVGSGGGSGGTCVIGTPGCGDGGNIGG